MKTIICTYKEEQKIRTEARKQRLISKGVQFISLAEYEKKLFDFGLRLITKGAYKYYNNMNNMDSHGHWLECSAEAVDELNISFANIKGKFYQNEREKDTFIYNQFREFRRNYFTQLKSGHLVQI